jgi:hypothetical protein
MVRPRHILAAASIGRGQRLRDRSGRLVFPGCPSRHANGQRRSTASWQRLRERVRGQVGKKGVRFDRWPVRRGTVRPDALFRIQKAGARAPLFARGTPVAFKGAADAPASAGLRLELLTPMWRGGLIPPNLNQNGPQVPQAAA